jgi:hypothetical protein
LLCCAVLFLLEFENPSKRSEAAIAHAHRLEVAQPHDGDLLIRAVTAKDIATVPAVMLSFENQAAASERRFALRAAWTIFVVDPLGPIVSDCARSTPSRRRVRLAWRVEHAFISFLLLPLYLLHLRRDDALLQQLLLQRVDVV